METLKSKWGKFGNVLFEPWVLIFLISTISLISFSPSDSANNNPRSFTVLWSVLIALSSSVLSGRVIQIWMESEQESVLRARGTISVRSLNLLLRSLSGLESRVKLFLASLEDSKKENKSGNNEQITKRNYEEILANASELQEETLSSIENWTDILPEADIKTQIGLISGLKDEIKDIQLERERLQSKYEEDKNVSDEEKTNLEEEIKKRSKTITKLKKELALKESSWWGNSSSNIVITSSPPTSLPNIDLSKLGTFTISDNIIDDPPNKNQTGEEN